MKNKHMTLDDRLKFKNAQGKELHSKHRQKDWQKRITISREVKQHLQVHSNGYTKTDAVCSRLLKAPFV